MLSEEWQCINAITPVRRPAEFSRGSEVLGSWEELEAVLVGWAVISRKAWVRRPPSWKTPQLEHPINSALTSGWVRSIFECLWCRGGT